MDLSVQQSRALDAIHRWLQGSDSPVFRLGGYAGTGKTTLARYVDDVDYFAAFTGKAAHVLQQKGCDASTIHSLIYRPADKSSARLKELMEEYAEDPNNEELKKRIAAERENLKRPMFTLNLDSPLYDANLIVIDEGSMIDEQIATDLLSFGVRILVLYDPAQLPPVQGRGHWTMDRPDYLLTEIHRQAADNPILRLATYVREHGHLPYDDPLVFSGRLTPEMALGVDQLIVGRNVTRRSSNFRMRDLLGFKEVLPEPNDKVVCLRNNHDLGLLNGAVYQVTESEVDEYDVLWITLDGGLRVKVHQEPFQGGEPHHWDIRDKELFDFGYALTCHKAQGSEWPKVGVVNEAAVFRQDAPQWLYTAITRASEELWVTA